MFVTVLLFHLFPSPPWKLYLKLYFDLLLRHRNNSQKFKKWLQKKKCAHGVSKKIKKLCTNKSSKSVYKTKKKCVHTRKSKKWLQNFEKWLQKVKKCLQNLKSDYKKLESAYKNLKSDCKFF